MDDYRNAQYPLARLLALFGDDRSYVERKVTVVGVLSIEFEDVRLYVSKEAFGYLNVSEAIGLDLTVEQVAASKAMQVGMLKSRDEWFPIPGLGLVAVFGSQASPAFPLGSVTPRH